LNAWLVFLDESGFLMAPLVRRSWNPRGHTPVLHQSGRHHRKVSAIAALCVAPARNRLCLDFRLHPDTNINGACVIEFLRLLQGQLGRFCLLWDHLQAHRAHLTQAFLRETSGIYPTYFPSYAPELNPMEYGWCWLKTKPLANLACHDLATLAATARHHGRSLQRQPRLLRSFIHHSPLPLRLI
jgi:transposase